MPHYARRNKVLLRPAAGWRGKKAVIAQKHYGITANGNSAVP
jgi:hypothetical protein